MKYFVVSDTHGFYDETITALTDAGFFTCKDKKKLIICGDLMDRGPQALQLQDFILDLYHKNEVIFIRGNHEDLMMDMLLNYKKYAGAMFYGEGHHCTNGTYDTALQLTNFSPTQAYHNDAAFITKVYKSAFVSKLIPASLDYYETEHYVFVHGWIPYKTYPKCVYNDKWRNASSEEWEMARWLNGINAAVCDNIIDPNKTIVCGHWHSSWGHKYINANSTEFELDSNYTPFYAPGIIAIDACTAMSKKVNCLVIDD